MANEMVKVRLKTGRVGNHIVQNVGDVIQCGEQEARRMVERGQAEWVGKAPEPKKD